MTRINVYTLKMVKESGANYDVDSAVKTPDSAVSAINLIFDLCNQPNEVFAILCLNTKNKIAGAHIISRGSLNSSIVHPREVFKAAILNNSSGIILFHNHPSGDSQPSREDIETTERLVKSGDLLGIKVLDHLIVGDGNHHSMKEYGEM